MSAEERQTLLKWIVREFQPPRSIRKGQTAPHLMITEHAPEEPTATHVHTAMVAAWLVDDHGLQPLGLDEAARREVAVEAEFEQRLASNMVRFLHPYGRARFAERMGTGTICLTLVWGPRFARGLAVKITERRPRLFLSNRSAQGLAVKVVDISWKS